MASNRQEEWDFEEFPTHEAYSADYWRKTGRMLHRLVREAVQSAGGKQGDGLAADVGANPTQFSEALKDGGVKRFAVEWLTRVIVADKTNRILRFLCALRQMEPKPLPVEDPAVKLARLIKRVESKGEMGRALLREEFGHETDDLVRSALGEE